MDDPQLLILWFVKVLEQLPGLIVALVACAVVLFKRKQAGSGAVWALVGFGLAVLLGTLIPGAQILRQQALLQNHIPLAEVGAAGFRFEMGWNGLQAVVYVLLLVAVFAGRAPGRAETPPPLPR